MIKGKISSLEVINSLQNNSNFEEDPSNHLICKLINLEQIIHRIKFYIHKYQQLLLNPTNIFFEVEAFRKIDIKGKRYDNFNLQY